MELFEIGTGIDNFPVDIEIYKQVNKLTEDSEQTVVEHWQGIKIGCRWNKTAKVWLPTDYINLDNPPTGALVPFNVESQVLFSSNYMAPVVDQGF